MAQREVGRGGDKVEGHHEVVAGEAKARLGGAVLGKVVLLLVRVADDIDDVAAAHVDEHVDFLGEDVK